jgi:tetratricopeptide (TPR) repeat protein
MRLSPYYATYILLQLAKAQRHTGRHEDAILANRKLICRSPELTFAWRDAALSYGALGQENEAQKAIAALLKIQPDYSIEDYIDKGDSGIDPEVRSRNIEILRRAGLPD